MTTLVIPASVFAQDHIENETKLECAPIPNVMAAQPNIRGALCESSVIPFLVSRRSLADARCSSAVQ